MSAGFNDEQIADDKSVSNMRVKYAMLTPFQKVKVLQEEPTTDNATLTGQSLQDENRYLQFLQEQSSGEARDYIADLRRVNSLELEELRTNFPSLRDLDKGNPRLIYRPYNLCLLNKAIMQNSLVLLGQLFELYVRETRPEVRQILERIIRRRIELLNILCGRNAGNNTFRL